MKAAVELLSKRLGECNHWKGEKLLFIWVSNRAIVEDATPDSCLLWVGKAELAKHAPLD